MSKAERGRKAIGEGLDQLKKGIRLDSWSNLLSKVGVVGRDKRVSSTVDEPQVFKVRHEMDALYHGNDLARKIIDFPAQEMVREWVRIRTTTMAPKEATTFSRDVLDSMETLDLQDKLGEAIAWARLYGGSCVFLGVDGGGAVHQPLNLEKARSLKFITVFDRHDIRVSSRYDDPLEANYGKPRTYEIISVINAADSRGFQPRNNQAKNLGKHIHESRMLEFEGVRTSLYRKRTMNDGWADSVFVSLISTLRGHDAVWQSTELLMQDFAQAVIKIQGLADAMATHGEEAVMARMELMDLSRGILRAIVLDAEKEDFERKPTPMTGLPEILDAWMHRLSAGTGIPVTLLYGRSPAGQNATGDSDFRIFYDKIEAEQKRYLRPQLEKFLTVLLNVDDGPTGGVEPESWELDFLPLWRLNELEESERRKNVADTDAIYIQEGVLTPTDVTRARFTGADYSPETTVDEETIEALAEVSAARQELELNPPEPPPMVAPGAPPAEPPPEE